VFLKAAFESNIRRQFKIGLHLILLTMVRKSELLLARWEHVDFEQAEWHIPAEPWGGAQPYPEPSCQKIARSTPPQGTDEVHKEKQPRAEAPKLFILF
jgi:integrase